MEYFPLGDLQKHMSKSGPMLEAHVRTVIYQVHTEKTPQNVLIKSQPPQKYCNRIRAPTEMLSTVKGTREYMAPELVYPKSVVEVNNQACDMWSLGEMAHPLQAFWSETCPIKGVYTKLTSHE
ncbi:hypothetical protein B0T26DRAFT_680457 [Lasiosphaeria miniovina]|uniref:Protein kinase domain-containing protein n=1 Tax=Lasiosphaeria miniovina TaxID=1954250 RepID=A0AA40A023_9PEZI|nr:uncharacterized protein B0T26DRAFT_680457 [Lasiosphaeria miniovina]KAK0706832.1 hypothetical protein B0T26DRAFT_680457 [Lasiosphaeria miniovina]